MKTPKTSETKDVKKKATVIKTPSREIDLDPKKFFDTYQIDHLGEMKPVTPIPVKNNEVPVRAQGSVAPLIVRTPEQAAAVTDDLKPYLLMNGMPLPHWVQVANLMHRPNKKVAIVGFADTRDQAPFNDPTFEIWGLNDLHGNIPRYDRWFEIHDRDNIQADVTAGRSDPAKCGIEPLKKLNVPIYMQEAYPDIPNAIKFPQAELRNQFGDYFTNSISFMLALAIFEGFTEIHVYGVDMAVGKEYIKERPSVEYFLGIAKGRGIKLYLPPACDLLKSRFIYGFEQKKQNAFNLKIENMQKSMQERLNNICQQEAIMHDSRMQYEGALGATREIMKIWSNLGDTIQV